MTEWYLEDPAELALEAVPAALEAAIVAGTLTVAVSDGPPRVVVDAVRGGPLVVTEEHGRLTIRHTHGRDDLAGGGVLAMVDGVIDAVLGSGGGRRYAEVAVLVPAPCEARLKSRSGDIVVSGLGVVTTETVSGRTTVRAVGGRLRASTVSGEIEVAGVTGLAWLKTVSGDVTVAGGRLDELAAHTVSGNVVMDADLAPGTHTFNSVSGDLALRLREDAGLDLEGSSVSGMVRCSVGVPAEDIRPGKRRWHAVTGDGSARLRTRTVSGDVTILTRPAGAEVA